MLQNKKIDRKAQGSLVDDLDGSMKLLKAFQAQGTLANLQKFSFSAKIKSSLLGLVLQKM